MMEKKEEALELVGELLLYTAYYITLRDHKFDKLVGMRFGSKVQEKFTAIVNLNNSRACKNRKKQTALVKKHLRSDLLAYAEDSTFKISNIPQCKKPSDLISCLISIIPKDGLNQTLTLNDAKAHILTVCLLVNCIPLFSSFVELGARVDDSLSYGMIKNCFVMHNKKMLQTLIDNNFLPQAELEEAKDERIENPKTMVKLVVFICKYVSINSITLDMLAAVCKSGLRADGVDGEWTVLSIACAFKREDVCEVLVKEAAASIKRIINQPAPNGFSILVNPVVHKNYNLVKLLLNAGADPNLPLDPKFRAYASTVFSTPQITKLLLDNGAEPVSIDIVEQLREAGDLPDDFSALQLNKLSQAILSRNVFVVNNLLAQGESPNGTGELGCTPIGRALFDYTAERSPELREIIISLLRHGANVDTSINSEDKMQFSAMAIAAFCSHSCQSLLPAMLEKSNNLYSPCIADSFGAPIDFVCANGDVETFRLFRASGKKLFSDRVHMITLMGTVLTGHGNMQLSAELVDYARNFNLENYEINYIYTMVVEVISQYTTEQRIIHGKGIEWLIQFMLWRLGMPDTQNIEYPELFINRVTQLVSSFRDMMDGAQYQDVFKVSVKKLNKLLKKYDEIYKIFEERRGRLIEHLVKLSEKQSLSIEWQFDTFLAIGKSKKMLPKNCFAKLQALPGVKLSLAESSTTILIEFPIPDERLMNNMEIITAARFNNNDSAEKHSQSSMAYFTEKYGSLERARQEMAAPKAKDISSFEIEKIETQSTIITWLNGQITQEMSEINRAINQERYFIFINEQSMRNQNCDEDTLKIFKEVRNFRTIGKCICKLVGEQPSVVVSIGKTQLTMSLTHEIKDPDNKKRIILAPLISDCKKYLLYVSVFYLKNGLHTTSDKEKLLQKCKNIQKIDIPNHNQLLSKISFNSSLGE